MWGLIIVDSPTSDPAAPTALWVVSEPSVWLGKIVTDLLARFGSYSQIEILFVLYKFQLFFFFSPLFSFSKSSCPNQKKKILIFHWHVLYNQIQACVKM